MLKFLTILCAATLCFAMASTDHYTRMLGKDLVKRRRNFATREVRSALKQLDRQFAVITSEPSRQNHNVMGAFKVNITREMEEMRPLIDVIIKDANSTFNETQCRSYWVEYEAAGQRVMCNIKTLIPTTVNATLTEIKEAFDVTTDALTKLERLKDQASSCQAHLCYQMSKAVGVVYHDFFQKTHSILCRGNRLAEPSTIQQVAQVKNLYAEYLTIGRSLITKTLACVNITCDYP